MPRGYAHRATAVVDTAPPRPLKTVSQKLGRFFGISKQVDPLDSFLFLKTPSDQVQSLPPLPEPLIANTNTSIERVPSLPDPEPRYIRVVGRGGAGSRLRVLATQAGPLISRQQTRDSQASSSSTSSSTSSKTVRYGGRGGAGRAYIIKPEEPKSYEADVSPPTQSNRNARIFDDVSPTSTISDHLPTPTDPFFPPSLRRPLPLIVIAEPDEDGVIHRIQPPLPSPTFWKKPSLVNLKKRDDSSDFFDRLPVRNHDSPIELPPRAASSLQIRGPSDVPSEMPFEEYIPMRVESHDSSSERRHKSWNGEWNEEVQSVINKLRML